MSRDTGQVPNNTTGRVTGQMPARNTGPVPTRNTGQITTRNTGQVTVRSNTGPMGTLRPATPERGRLAPRLPLYVKITAASFLVTLVVIIFVSVVAFRDEKQALEDKVGLTLSHVVRTAALFIDGDAHERVHTNADATGLDFVELRRRLELVRRQNDLQENEIYTLRPVEGANVLEFVVMLQRDPFVGNHYRPRQENRVVMERVLMDGISRYTSIYTDENNSYISAYGAIRDHRGRIVGLLEVDYDIARFVDELWKSLLQRLWIVPAALLLALALALGVAQSIARSVRHLVDAAEAVRRGDYRHRVVLRTRDELHTLAEAFNDMLRHLRERFAMLRFVPRHTRAIIAQAVQSKNDVPLGGAHRRNVAVFFSDIRGFTAMSDRLTPDRIIHMLNIYLRHEAQIIERNNGSVDKFIGDGVMALFEGPDRFLKAARAALEIQQAMRRLNAERAFEEEIRVGIGIAGGEVVMGSIGYENRLEYAVIGRLVNLASRLTSKAAPGEIMVSEYAWEHMRDRYEGDVITGMQLKGFADEVTCYRLRGTKAPDAPAASSSTAGTTGGAGGGERVR